MAHMFPSLGVPLPNFISPHTHPLAFALTQLILTIPVLIAGGRYKEMVQMQATGDQDRPITFKCLPGE